MSVLEEGRPTHDILVRVDAEIVTESCSTLQETEEVWTLAQASSRPAHA